MFGSFMPQMGRGMSKASSLFGNQGEPQVKAPGGEGFGKPDFSQFMGRFGQGMGMGQSPATPPFNGRAMGPGPGFGQMLGGMFGGRMPNDNPNAAFNRFNPTPPVQQIPVPEGMQGRPWGDLSGMPGQIGDMYRQGKIQTMAGPLMGGFKPF